jgi:hypothetical protein
MQKENECNPSLGQNFRVQPATLSPRLWDKPSKKSSNKHADKEPITFPIHPRILATVFIWRQFEFTCFIDETKRGND